MNIVFIIIIIGLLILNLILQKEIDAVNSKYNALLEIIGKQSEVIIDVSKELDNINDRLLRQAKLHLNSVYGKGVSE